MTIPRKPLVIKKPTTADSNTLIPRRRIVKKSEKKRGSVQSLPKKKGILESGGHIKIKKYTLEPIEDGKFLGMSQS
jgi:hypothetical protein